MNTTMTATLTATKNVRIVFRLFTFLTFAFTPKASMPRSAPLGSSAMSFLGSGAVVHRANPVQAHSVEARHERLLTHRRRNGSWVKHHHMLGLLRRRVLVVVRLALFFDERGEVHQPGVTKRNARMLIATDSLAPMFVVLSAQFAPVAPALNSSSRRFRVTPFTSRLIIFGWQRTSSPVSSSTTTAMRTGNCWLAWLSVSRMKMCADTLDTFPPETNAVLPSVPVGVLARVAEAPLIAAA